jgi:hypothetical protein
MMGILSKFENEMLLPLMTPAGKSMKRRFPALRGPLTRDILSEFTL